MKTVAHSSWLGWLSIFTYHCVEEESLLCRKETNHGLTSNTSVYPVYATGVAVWIMTTRTATFGWIANEH